jgi:putative SOS response-associated peptidase YedK
MTCLLRARGAVSEIAALFDAAPDAGLIWSEVIWPGETLLIVTEPSGTRRLAAACWGLPALTFHRQVPASQHGTLFMRDLVEGGRLAPPLQLRRCLIVVEAFAYPAGRAGHRTRSWFGLSEHPLAAWAGVVTEDGSACAGLMAPANNQISPFSDHMPRLLQPADHQPWLAGAGPLSLSPAWPDTAYYREDLGELWSTGLLPEEKLPLGDPLVAEPFRTHVG